MAHPLLYEINARCWLRALSKRLGQPVTLANVPDSELAAWETWGFTHIWLMGVWTSGNWSRAEALRTSGLRQAFAEALPDWAEDDVVGSPYAIADYTVASALGGEQALADFRHRLNRRGLKLVLDFVPNHLGLDHSWARDRPDLFVQAPLAATCPPGTFQQPTIEGPRCLAHGKDPYFSAWTDTVQLDYRRAETRAAMTDLLRSVADRCDGVRCDMAMLLLEDVFAKTWSHFPVAEWGQQMGPPAQRAEQEKLQVNKDEFWSTAISSVKQDHPGFLFLAEAYWGTEPRLQELGFDFTYDKVLYDKLVAHDAAGVQAHLLSLAPQELAAGAHFLENHDEPRIATLLSPAEQCAAVLVILGLPGLRFLHEGQLGGARRRLPVQLGRRFDEPMQPEIKAFYDRLLAAVKSSAVGHGSFELVRPQPAWPENPTASNIILVRWARGPVSFDLVVVNVASHHSQCYAPLKGTAAHSQWRIRDRLGPERYLRQGAELQSQGLYLDLHGHATHMFEFSSL